ncbi:bifunctional riboflavin kinase/FAD synthetase [Roseibium alexandrii]|jgi:riboflavin kinase/FMN adenylyltransferase|uniref:Riboflavin biosynthesis protein n=1 Tax=Roseibium alexandrii (strain DSM 17067 / NCIMB 14079 / DFL-11) TaxID=244592 RepID=A0A5E8H0G8_ROSAD|nr:bifunctional riboflavin kinase/FAD synthetase [Roseibium alexandrii]EEE45784.1 riboflavin kinase/FMN adenylyltransferase [Roseibium alexandrii DFL-11]
MNRTPSSEFQIAESLESFPASLKGGVVAIGNFDGVHRGHRAVLDAALGLGRGTHHPVFAMSFEPHPRTVFNPAKPVFRLTPPPLKTEMLRVCGLDGALILPFTKDFAAVDANAFVQDILIDTLGISHAVTGYDFHFGRARQGTPDYLRAAGAQHGFGVTIVQREEDENADVISSSRIRDNLATGDMAEANALLGYRWFFESQVQHGDKRGRDLGYPTANLRMPEDCPLLQGIYAVKVKVGENWYGGVASYGRRPTFDNGAALFEVYLFDFKGDLYGKTLRVHVVSYLRGEAKFDNAEALISQMDRDSEEARAALASLQPLSEIDLKLLDFAS